MTDEGDWGVETRYGQGVDASGREQLVIRKSTKYAEIIMEPGNGEEIGGFRIDPKLGAMFHDNINKVWVPFSELGGVANAILAITG